MIGFNGVGVRNPWFINALGQLATQNAPITDQHNKAGLLYNLNTGSITLTNAVQISAAFLKNNEVADLVVFSIFQILGNSNITAADARVTVIRSPTAGDIVTNANDGAIKSNLNYGSTRPLLADFFKGAQAETVFTDGDDSIDSLLTPPVVNPLTELGGIRLPRGNSLGVNFTPPAANTNITFQIAFLLFVDNLVSEGSVGK